MEQLDSRELFHHTRGCRRLVRVDIDDGLGKGLGCFLRQIMPDTARDDPVRIAAREFAGIGAGVRVKCPIGIAFQGHRGHGDVRSLGEPLFQFVIVRLALGQPEPPAISMDHDADMIWIVEGRCAALEGGLVEVPFRRSELPDELRKVVPVFVVAGPAAFSSSLEQRINQLIGRLQERRCLLVLDNLETLLEVEDPEGNYRAGYQGYGRLIERLGESAHQSCVVLTSREKPREIEAAEGLRAPVRSLRLVGLSQEAARSLLQDKDLRGASSAWLQLIATYAGNPLALKIVGQAIVDLFASEIIPFLHSGELIFNGIRVVLRQQLARLTPLEQTLLTWLAVVREWTSLDSLLSLLVKRPTRTRVLEALEALSRRSLIERGQRASFTLQSVVMEYVTDALLDRLSEEIVTQAIDHLYRYALEQAQAKDYVRQTQVRLLVRPLVERLRAELGSDTRVEEQCLSLLRHMRTEAGNSQGYGPANVIALLKALRSDLRSLDLSQLAIRGAYVQGIEMQDANLSGAVMRECVFSEAFDAITAVAISRSGQYWAAISWRGEVRVWREEGKLLHLAWQAHTDTTYAFALSPDEQHACKWEHGWQRQAVGRREGCLALVGLAHEGHHVPGFFPRWKTARQWEL